MPRLSALAVLDLDAIALPAAVWWPVPVTLGEAFAAWAVFAACVVRARAKRGLADRTAFRTCIARTLADAAFRRPATEEDR